MASTSSDEAGDQQPNAARKLDQEPSRPFPLLKFPTEILHEIFGWIRHDKKTLSSLALANKMCHELAIKQQFASVYFRPDKIGSWQLMFRLVQEGLEHEEVLGQQKDLPAWRIGPCIRELRLQDARWASPDQLPSAEDLREQLSRTIQNISFAKLHDEVARQAYTACEAMHHDFFRPQDVDYEVLFGLNPPAGLSWFRHSLCLLIRSVIPRLEVLRLASNDNIGEDDWSTITSCAKRLRALSLHWHADKTSYSRLELKPGSWSQLVSLNLNLDLYQSGAGDIDSAENIPADDVTTQILRACAPTLRILAIALDRENHAPAPCPAHHIEFPELQDLTVVSSIDVPGLLESLFKSPVRRLRFDRDLTWSSVPLSYGNMPALKDTSLPKVANVGEAFDAIAFLERHQQIQKLHFNKPCPDYALIHSHIIPHLATGNLPFLTSLSIVWIPWRMETSVAALGSSARRVAGEMLANIGRINSLRHLHLVVGGPCCVYHSDIKRHLRGLKDLRLLAISGDLLHLKGFSRPRPREDTGPSIDIDPSDGMFGSLRDMTVLRSRPDLDKRYFGEGWDFKGYKKGVWDPDADEVDHGCQDFGYGPINDRYCSLGTDRCMSLIHRNTVLEEAELYVPIFPSLQRLYFGQMLVEITAPGGRGLHTAYPLMDSMWEFPVEKVFQTEKPEEYNGEKEDDRGYYPRFVG